MISSLECPRLFLVQPHKEASRQPSRVSCSGGWAHSLPQEPGKAATVKAQKGPAMPGAQTPQHR